MKISNKKNITPLSNAVFSKKIIALGYREGTDIEKVRTFKKIIVGNPRPQEFAEQVWQIERNGYIGKIQTTVLPRCGKLLVAESDQAWALISKGDSGVFFMQPFNRKNYFFDNLLYAAKVIKEMVTHLPLCQECSASMTFVNDIDDPRFYNLVCSRHTDHPIIENPYSIVFEHLDAQTYQWLSKRLARSEYYKKTAPGRGIQYGEAKKKRKPWLTNKENLE